MKIGQKPRKEKEKKKIEIGNLPYKEFKEIVIKMTEIRIK